MIWALFGSAISALGSLTARAQQENQQRSLQQANEDFLQAQQDQNAQAALAAQLQNANQRQGMNLAQFREAMAQRQVIREGLAIAKVEPPKPKKAPEPPKPGQRKFKID